MLNRFFENFIKPLLIEIHLLNNAFKTIMDNISDDQRVTKVAVCVPESIRK